MFQARLKPGVTSQQAEADISVIAQRLAQVYPKNYPKKFTVKVVSWVDSLVGRFRRTLYTLAAAVGLLLLIACSNVANMLLAEGYGSREGDGNPGFARRQPDATGPPTAGRELSACPRWSGRRVPVRALPESRLWCGDPRRPHPPRGGYPTERAGPVIQSGGCHFNGGRVRSRSRAPDGEAGPGRRA